MANATCITTPRTLNYATKVISTATSLWLLQEIFGALGGEKPAGMTLSLLSPTDQPSLLFSPIQPSFSANSALSDCGGAGGQDLHRTRARSLDLGDGAASLPGRSGGLFAL